MKITENPEEFQSLIDNDNKTGLCLEDTLSNRSAPKAGNLSYYLDFDQASK